MTIRQTSPSSLVLAAGTAVQARGLVLAVVTAVLSLGGGASPSAQGSGTLVNPSDIVYEAAVRTMRIMAARAGVTIDTDVDVLRTARGDVFYATIDGFEQIDLRIDARDGVDVGFLFVRGAAHLPVGFYVMQIVIDPERLQDAFAWLIDARGNRFFMPLEVTTDPHPERGPRKVLTSEGGPASAVVRPGIGIGDLVVNGDLEL
jgi:hypothetical protein